MSLEKALLLERNQCDNISKCTHCQRLIAINKLFVNSPDDIIDIILVRKIEMTQILDSYIHCQTECKVIDKVLDSIPSNEANKVCPKILERYRADKLNKMDDGMRSKYYGKQMEHVAMLQVLDMIHCFLCLRGDTANAQNTKNRITPNHGIHGIDHFGGRPVDYWSFYEGDADDSDECDDSTVDGEHHTKLRGVAVEPKYDSLKMEVTQNEIAPLSEHQFDDIYLHSLRLLRTVFCRKNMRALYDITLNERFKMAPNIGLTVNHIISMVIYCDYYAVCCQWKMDVNPCNIGDFMESTHGHWYRYLSEMGTLFGHEMGHNEYLYIIPQREVLFKSFVQMIHVPVSVHPPLDRSQSFIRELRQYHSERPLDHDDDGSGGSRHILKLGRTEMDGLTTRFVFGALFGVILKTKMTVYFVSNFCDSKSTDISPFILSLVFSGTLIRDGSVAQSVRMNAF